MTSLTLPNVSVGTTVRIPVADINAALFATGMDETLQSAVNFVVRVGFGVDLDARDVSAGGRRDLLDVLDDRVAFAYGEAEMTSPPEVVIDFLRRIGIRVHVAPVQLPLIEHRMVPRAGGLRPDPEDTSGNGERINPMFKGHACSCGAIGSLVRLDADSDWYARHLAQLVITKELQARRAELIEMLGPKPADDEDVRPGTAALLGRIDELTILSNLFAVEGRRSDIEIHPPDATTFDTTLRRPR